MAGDVVNWTFYLASTFVVYWQFCAPKSATAPSAKPLCDMASKITLRNKLHDFEWIKKKLNPDQKCVKTRSEFIFKLDWLNKIRTWLKKLISDTISLTENVRENNLTRQNHSAEKILTENPQNLSEKIFEF